jgi:predicted nucleic acid-binding Zn ribbon protein
MRKNVITDSQGRAVAVVYDAAPLTNSGANDANDSLALTEHCPLCGGNYTRADMMDDGFLLDGYEAAILAHTQGKRPCMECANSAIFCDACGNYVPESHVIYATTPLGDEHKACSEDCNRELLEYDAEWRGHFLA